MYRGYTDNPEPQVDTDGRLLHAPPQTRNAVFRTSPTGKVQEVNEIACQWLGYTAEELLSMTVFEINPTLTQTMFDELWQRLRETRSQTFESRHQRKDGSTFPIEISMNLIEFKGEETCLSIVQDISERLETFATMLTGQNIFERVMQTTVAAITVVDAHGRVVLANERARDILGLSPSEIEGRAYDAPQWQITAIDGSPFPKEDLPFARVMRTGEPVFDVRHAICWPDGRRRILSINGAPLAMPDHAFYGAVFCVEDITERLESMIELRESREHYRHAAETNRRLLKEVNHRVRNNLSGLLSLLNITRDQTQDVGEFAELLRRRIAGMSKAHNLLAGGGWQGLDLQALLRGLSVGHCPTCPQDPKLHLEGPAVRISSRQAVPLAMALNELYVNAAKHGCHSTPEGMLTITWRIEGETVIIDWLESDGPTVRDGVPSLGSELIKGFIQFELGGKVKLRYPQGGAHHELRLPIESEDEPPPTSTMS